MTTQTTQYPGECVYIAGPECFYTGGNETLLAMRRLAESHGMKVSLPNDTPLKLDHDDKRKNADTIFENCARSMNASTAIIADLETFRGTEPDGGTIYEIGMAYARGIRCYAYTRDRRAMLHKYPGVRQGPNGQPMDLDGRILPYANLPFSPCVVASSKIVEGDFAACLKTMMLDIDEERKFSAKAETKPETGPKTEAEPRKKPLVYLASARRYDPDAADYFETMKALAAGLGLTLATPADDAPGLERLRFDDPYAEGYHCFDHWQRQVRRCDALLADLSDFHGLEPQSDVSFEAGMAWQLGKPCFGFLPDARPMRQRIPHLGEAAGGKDLFGNDVENFDYPVNLMFSSSMPIFEGDCAVALQKVAESLRKQQVLPE